MITKPDPIRTIVDSAKENRIVSITYAKLGEAKPTVRIVEPYAFIETRGEAMLIRCVQLEPDPGGQAWRSFRVDRIVDAKATRRRFEPVRPVTIGNGEVEPFSRRAAKSNAAPADAYRVFVVESIGAGRVSILDRMMKARKLKKGLSDGQVRAVHASVFGDMLEEFGEDGVIDDIEAAMLVDARRLLRKLGWAP